jgi:5-bromo-4-chloroindolyl phosphate hydrolysis protein
MNFITTYCHNCTIQSFIIVDILAFLILKLIFILDMCIRKSNTRIDHIVDKPCHYLQFQRPTGSLGTQSLQISN